MFFKKRKNKLLEVQKPTLVCQQMDPTCHFKNVTILIIKNGNGKNFTIEQLSAAYEKTLVSFKDFKSSETNKTKREWGLLYN